MELLVTVSVISLLLAVLVPSLSKARQQAKGTVCLGRCRELGVGMTMYLSEYDCYPAHQWRLGDPADTRVRWFNAMAKYLAGYRVQSCPATPGWEVASTLSWPGQGQP